MGVRLPPEYQEVEYLESNGNQYCLTDVLYHREMDSEAVFMPTSSSQDSFLFGGTAKHQGPYDRWYVANMGWYSRRLQYFYGNYKYFEVGTAGNRYQQTVNTKYHAISSLKNGSQTMTINGQTLLEGKNTLPVVTPIIGYISLFAHNNPSSTGGAPEYGSKYKGRIYSLKLLSDGELLGDFVPCRIKANNKPGMFNLVTGGFFTNQGTGEFIIGPDVFEPIGYISPWLMERRRLLMRKLDTSPKIAEYNKRLRGNNRVENYNGLCVTKWYDIDTIQSVQAGFAWNLGTPVPSDMESMYHTAKADGTYINHYYWNRPVLFANSGKIRFTLRTEYIEDCWAYNPIDGQIWFAGKNTQYYGYRNIHNMPQG